MVPVMAQAAPPALGISLASRLESRGDVCKTSRSRSLDTIVLAWAASQLQILVVRGIPTIRHSDRRLEPMGSGHELVQFRSQGRVHETRQPRAVKHIKHLVECRLSRSLVHATRQTLCSLTRRSFPGWCELESDQTAGLWSSGAGGCSAIARNVPVRPCKALIIGEPACRASSGFLANLQ